MAGESLSLTLLMTYHADVYKPGSNEAVLMEEGVPAGFEKPLRFENFTMQYPLGFYFLPREVGKHAP